MSHRPWQLGLFGKLPLLSELSIKLVRSSGDDETNHKTIKFEQRYIDEGLAILQKSDVKTPKVLTVTRIVGSPGIVKYGYDIWWDGQQTTITI